MMRRILANVFSVQEVDAANTCSLKTRSMGGEYYGEAIHSDYVDWPVLAWQYTRT